MKEKCLERGDVKCRVAYCLIDDRWWESKKVRCINRLSGINERVIEVGLRTSGEAEVDVLRYLRVVPEAMKSREYGFLEQNLKRNHSLQMNAA